MIGFEPGRPWHRIAAETFLGRGVRTTRPPANRLPVGVEAVYLLYVIASIPLFFVKAWSAGQQLLVPIPAASPNDGVPLVALVDSVLAGLAALMPLLVVAIVVSLCWAMIFARVRGRPVDPAWAMVAWIYVLLLPADLSPALAALGMSFAAVLGQHVFGGSGRYIVSPALLGAIFVAFSYPDAASVSITLSWRDAVDAMAGDAGDFTIALASSGAASAALPMAAASIAGVAPLVRAGILSWQILAGAVLGVVATTLLISVISDMPIASLGWQWHLALGGMPVCLAFVLTDPTVQALSRGGRWIHGILFAVLAVSIRLLDPAHPDGSLFAALLATLAMPLIDFLVLRGQVTRSRGRLELRS